MRTQQLLVLSGLMLAGNVAFASKLDHDDVPNRCWSVCGDVVGISKSCDARHDNDSAEIKCICDWEKAKTQIPLCSACITQYQTDGRNNGTSTDHDHDHDHDGDDDDYNGDRDDDDDDNEALDLVHSCSLTTTTYNSAATTASGSSTSTGTGTGTAASTSATTTDSSSSSGTNGQDSTSSSGSGSSAGSASSSTPTPDAAVDLSAPGALSMAGIMGLMAFAWL